MALLGGAAPFSLLGRCVLGSVVGRSAKGKPARHKVGEVRCAAPHVAVQFAAVLVREGHMLMCAAPSAQGKADCSTLPSHLQIDRDEAVPS